MDIKNKISSFFKTALVVLKDFFVKEDKATRTKLSKLDMVDIFVSLAPAAIFGCLLFGLRAVLVLLISVLIPCLFDFLWNLIFKKEKKVNFILALGGMILGLSLNSKLNILLVVAACLAYAALCKFVFCGKELYLAFPVLISRAVFSLVFYGAFNTYSLPFMNIATKNLPINYIFGTYSFIPPAKYLFFGIHAGNIGETSVLLLLLGVIYLMIRKMINPVVPTCFVASTAVLCLIFGRSLPLSLLGGGLFFAAFLMAIDYSFKTTPLYKKIVFGLLCGVLTFILREIFKTEAVTLAVLISYLSLFYINRKNIRIAVSYIGGLVNKSKLEEKE
ncbi:MAG: hypothetical protein E7537_03155 [Ruminococcaceae bacterium]|nr:hypothetical protein [Oscillospiraceae bacterium]